MAILVALAACESNKPLVETSATETFTPPQWQRIDDDVCRRSGGPPGSPAYEHCMALFDRLGPDATATESP